MFENILGQDQLVEDLTRDLQGGALPSSLLFHGPDYSGKLSCALELARALTCEDPRAPWNCGCQSCRQQRILTQPYTLMIGDRYFRDEIEACGATYQRTLKTPTRYLFVRSVRKLLRRFDSVFSEEKDAGVKKVRSALSELEERIRLFHPDEAELNTKNMERELKKISDLTAKITTSGGANRITIDQIRRISTWAHQTSEGQKVIIIENADKMNDSARNALLKILEEPPPRVSFILLTSRKGGIMPTILSRVRPYTFIPRDETTSREILTRIFREENHEYATLREYFLAWNINLEGVRRGSRRFLDGLKNSEPLDRENLEKLFPKGGDHRKTFRVFLQEILFQLQESYSFDKLIEKPLRGEKFSEWNDLFRNALSGSETYNQSPSLLAEGLYYAMRGDR